MRPGWTRLEAGHYRHSSGATVFRVERHVNTTRAYRHRDFADSRREVYWGLKLTNGQTDGGHDTAKAAMRYAEKYDPLASTSLTNTKECAHQRQPPVGALSLQGDNLTWERLRFSQVVSPRCDGRGLKHG